MILRALLLSIVLVGWGVSPAWAHPGHEAHGGHGFVEGLLHPWTGLDHLLAMLAVGLLAAGIGGRMLPTMPGVFLASMLGGAGLAGSGIALPGVEVGMALSVVLLGAALAWGCRYPEVVAAATVGLFGLLHGYAHGAEMPGHAAPLVYVLGMVLGTAILLGCGGAIGYGLRTMPTTQRMCGGAVSAVGILLLWTAM